MSRWFRIYDELLDDPKAQRLPPELFKAWVNILCVASRGGGVLPDLDDMAFSLRVTRDVTQQWIDALRERGLIDVDSEDGSMSPHNWNNRQFRSDADPTAAERQRRKRAKDALERRPAVTRDVTPPRADTEAETEAELREANASLVAAEAGDATRGVGNVVKIERKPSTAGKPDAVRAAGEWWNDLASSQGLRQIDAIKPNSSREAQTWARCRELAHDFGALSQGLDAIGIKIRGSPFLCGRVGSFRATFDWVMNATNFQKIMEGNYEDSEEKRAVR